MSNDGYMESEGMKRGSATNQRMRSDTTSVTPMVSQSSFVRLPRNERTSPAGCASSSGRRGSSSPPPAPPPLPEEPEAAGGGAPPPVERSAWSVAARTCEMCTCERSSEMCTRRDVGFAAAAER
jgi:hypothetical protein